MKLVRLVVPRKIFVTQNCSLLLAMVQANGLMDLPLRAAHVLLAAALPAMFLLRSTREEIYNILWALVFGFATINILSLGARKFEQDRGLSFGEILAILVVAVSIILLGWEMLYWFGILPIKLTPR
jgi:hypothetical protein